MCSYPVPYISIVKYFKVFPSFFLKRFLINFPRLFHQLSEDFSQLSYFPIVFSSFQRIFLHFSPHPWPWLPWLLSRLQLRRRRLGRGARQERWQHFGHGAGGDFAQLLAGFHDATPFLLQEIGDLHLEKAEKTLGWWDVYFAWFRRVFFWGISWDSNLPFSTWDLAISTYKII